MIDSKEELITLANARTLLPGRPSIPTLWRWRSRGVRGRVLESVVIGGRVYTSREALRRFTLNGSEEPGTPRPSASREGAVIAARQRLARGMGRPRRRKVG